MRASAEGLDEPRVVLLPEETPAEPVGVHPRLRREHAQEQLLLRHLEAEHADGLAALDGRVQRHVEDETRLAHRGPGRHDHEIRLLKARRHLVEIGEPGRHAGDEAAMLLQLLDELVAGVDEVADLDEPRAEPVFGDLEDRPLRFVQQIVGVLLGVVRPDQDLVGRLDQATQRGFLLDDLGVVLDVGRPRHAVRQRRDVGRAAHFLQFAGSRELILDGDEIDRFVPVDQLDDDVEQPPVRIPEEVLGVDDLGGLVEDRVVDEDGAENALLGFEIMGQGAVGHGQEPYPTSNFKRQTSNVELQTSNVELHTSNKKTGG
jgi:hypothetical protein